MMNKRLDFFGAKREMSGRVVEYTRCVILRKEIQLAYAKKITELNTSIENLKNLEGSVFADKLPEMRTTYLAQIANLEAERDARIKEEAKFELTEADKTFKKAMKKAGTASDLQAEAVCVWFKEYGLDVADTYFLDEILGFFGGKFDFRQYVATEGEDGRTVDQNRALQMLYWTAYTHMVRVGTIKRTEIPELIREKFAPKVNTKKAKKATK